MGNPALADGPMVMGVCLMWLGVSEANRRYGTKPATPRISERCEHRPTAFENLAQQEPGPSGSALAAENEQQPWQNPAERIRASVAKAYETARTALNSRREGRWQAQKQQLAEYTRRKAELKGVKDKIWRTTDPWQLRTLNDDKKRLDWDIHRLDMGIFTQYGLILGDDLAEAKLPPVS